MKFLFALIFISTLGVFIATSAESCICTYEYNPVCSTYNNTYGNLCQLKCAGEELDYYGECSDRFNQDLTK